jgi:ankyrin repeat protein
MVSATSWQTLQNHDKPGTAHPYNFPMKKIFCLLLLASSALGSHADDAIALRLQKGLFEEEANHNLPAAIEQYKAVITATDEQRKLAATALFRLGESYHKLGREAEANEAYSRLVRDFPDQKEIASRASERIANATPPLASMTLKTPKGGSVTNDNKLAALAALLDSSPDLLNSEFATNGMTLLKKAVTDGDIEMMKFLITRGADVNKGAAGITPLSLAVSRGNKDAAELLIEAGANINARNIAGSTALHSAASHGFTILAGLLLDKGADVNVRNSRAQTPLYLAASKGFASTVELLIKRGADFENVSVEGMTPLGIAIQGENNQVVKTLIKAGANPNTPSREGESPLLLAVKNRNNECAEILLANGADVNAADKDGVTPLIWILWYSIEPGTHDYQAAVGLSEIILNTLLQYHADLNSIFTRRGMEGQSAIHIAANSYENIPARILEILLKHGGNPNLQDAKGETPLHLAVGAQHGISTVSAFDREHNKALLAALGLSPLVDAKKIVLLLQHKANPSVADNTGRTPLFYSARGEPAEAAYAGTKALLTAHADPNVKDENGQTPLDVANEYTTDQRIITLLKEHGAKSGISSPPEAGAKRKETGGAVTNTTSYSIPSHIRKREIPAQQIHSAPQ